MNATAQTLKKIDKKVLISTLWIVVMINMLKADILSLYIPGATEKAAKTAGSRHVDRQPGDGLHPRCGRC